VEGFAEIKELSVNGMFVVDRDPLPKGTLIQFALRLGTDDIPLQGAVTRCEPGRGMAIVFRDLTPQARMQLKIYIGGLASEERKRAR
jgi:hypothetical protein